MVPQDDRARPLIPRSCTRFMVVVGVVAVSSCAGHWHIHGCREEQSEVLTFPLHGSKVHDMALVKVRLRIYHLALLLFWCVRPGVCVYVCVCVVCRRMFG